MDGRRKVLLGALGILAGLYFLGNQLTQYDSRRRVSDLENAFIERVHEINQENRRVGITAQEFMANSPVDSEIRGIIQKREARLSEFGTDKSSWMYFPVAGDSLSARLYTNVETYSATGFLKN